MLPLGRDERGGLAVRQERVVRDRRERAPAERDVSDDLPHRVQQRVRRPRARAGRWGRAAAPGGCPRRGSRASPRDAPRIVHVRSSPCGLRSRTRAGRPSPRSSDSDSPPARSRSSGRRGPRTSDRRRLERAPARPGGARASLPTRSSPRFVSRVGSQPSRVASQPSSSSAGDGRVGVVADGDRGRSSASSCRRARRVERGRDPLAPRRRAQPGEVDDVQLVGRTSTRAAAPSSTSGSSTVSSSTTCARRRSESSASPVAVRRPHHGRPGR